MREDGGLGIVGEGELFFRPFPHEPGKPGVEGIIDSGEDLSGFRKPLGEILAHANPLCALAGAHQYSHHRTTALPQVNPAPNATNRSNELGFTRPSVIAWSKARGIEADEVLP